MNKLLMLSAFVLMMAAQWWVPGKMIFDQEKVLTEGAVYKFKTRPIDPSDPFRGKYIYLHYEMNRVKQPSEDVNRNDMVYVYLDEDEEGFAKATHCSLEKLDIEQDYLLLQVNTTYQDSVRFSLPFSIFYMEESKAYLAETLVREANRDSLLNNCYGLVHILGEAAVLKDVIVNDIPIKEYVEKHLKENTED